MKLIIIITVREVATDCMVFVVFYARQQELLYRVLAIALFCLSVRPSVCLSDTRVDQAKTVQARIIKSSPQLPQRL